jgi:hypothetical protein
VRKQPSTSELIDWVKILHHWGVAVEALRPELPLTAVPYWEMLFKHQQDVQAVKQHAARGGEAT